jgi:Fe(3+) dicitrate transport protein
MKYLFICLFFVAQHLQMAAQEKSADSLNVKSLDSVFITSYLKQATLQTLPDQQGTYLFKGKKSEVIKLSQTDANFADKTARQVFAKVPGIFVYDMDGAGNQVNISTRGLDPHRGWEFNIRKDGIITNSDMYAYPASHFSMPFESLDHIELVRGTGSLQYGSQFGGRLNYVSKQGDTTRPFGFETINTVGTFHLLSTFNAIGGKVGKLRYYAYISKKSRGGYRDNEHTDSEAQSVALTYDATTNLSIKAEWSHSSYTYRIPGQLNDSMFHADPKQASRSRNYFNPDIHVPSVVLKWNITPNTTLEFTSSAVLGRRNSVMFDKATNIKDTINAATMQYNNRQVDIDQFNSYTSELRVLQNYYTGKRAHTLVAGIQYMNNNLHRRQLGKGTTGSDFDLSLVEPGWGRDVHLKTQNVAIFAENNFEIIHNLTFNAGVRMEMGKSDMSGTINYYPAGEIPLTIKHHFPLFGAGLQYKTSGNSEIYAGWSQSYRAMAFKDLIPVSPYEKIDPNIKDAYGYNLEAGFRGKWQFLKWDVTGYMLQYNNRFGTLSETDDSGEFYTWRTNIGNSLSKGLEIFLQADWRTGSNAAVSLFTSTAFMDACYTKGNAKSGNDNIDVAGNKVESAPNLITRNGLTFRYRRMSISGLYSYTASSFADALNTVKPNATGSVGVVPSYGLLDFNATAHITRNIEVRLNLNNAANKKYFTKRPAFYPGPGIWPSEGSSFNASVAVRL